MSEVNAFDFIAEIYMCRRQPVLPAYLELSGTIGPALPHNLARTPVNESINGSINSSID